MSKFINYANSFQTLSRLGLDGIKKLCGFLGNPQDNLKFIHVAGTNGKGSVCAILQTALTFSGLKTGKYISPNLIDVCERITVDGVEITHFELEKIMERVKVGADRMLEETGVYPTQFELWTAAAFLYFNDKKTDIVVLETGLGGDRDATNIVKNTICSVITKISFDHMSYLGNSLMEIAEVKAGIIKDSDGRLRRITVSSAQPEEAMEVLKKKAAEMNNDFFVADSFSSKGTYGIYEIFDFDDQKNVVCGLGGLHQLENAATAAKALKLLGINSNSIRYGIEHAKNPARFEQVLKNPNVVFDGAHNADGIEALASNIDRYFNGNTINFVMGIMADKDLDEMLMVLKKHSFNINTKFYAVSVKENPRAMKAKELSEALNKNGFLAEPVSCVSEAVNAAAENADVVFIFGSLYLYKDFSEEMNAVHSLAEKK